MSHSMDMRDKQPTHIFILKGVMKDPYIQAEDTDIQRLLHLSEGGVEAQRPRTASSIPAGARALGVARDGNLGSLNGREFFFVSSAGGFLLFCGLAKCEFRGMERTDRCRTTSSTF